MISSFKIGLVLLGLAFVVGVATLIKAAWNKSMIERQCEGYFSTTVESSRDRGLFIFEYGINPVEVSFGEGAFRIKSAWLEHHAAWSYNWIWLFCPKPTAQKRVVVLTESVDEKPAGIHLWIRGMHQGFVSTSNYQFVTLPVGLPCSDLVLDCTLGRETRFVYLSGPGPSEDRGCERPSEKGHVDPFTSTRPAVPPKSGDASPAEPKQ